jgi:hypothetical protein
MLALMMRSRSRRIRRMNVSEGNAATVPHRRVSDRELFEQSQEMRVKGMPVLGLSGIRPRTVVVKEPN